MEGTLEVTTVDQPLHVGAESHRKGVHAPRAGSEPWLASVSEDFCTLMTLGEPFSIAHDGVTTSDRRSCGQQGQGWKDREEAAQEKLERETRC